MSWMVLVVVVVHMDYMAADMLAVVVDRLVVEVEVGVDRLVVPAAEADTSAVVVDRLVVPAAGNNQAAPAVVAANFHYKLL